MSKINKTELVTTAIFGAATGILLAIAFNTELSHQHHLLAAKEFDILNNPYVQHPGEQSPDDIRIMPNKEIGLARQEANLAYTATLGTVIAAALGLNAARQIYRA